MYDYIKGILANKSNATKGFWITIEVSNGVGFLLEITGF